MITMGVKTRNPYLDSIRAQYTALQESIEGLQQRAATAKRDLTPEELRSVVEMGEKSDLLYTEIQSLSDIELRNAKVAQMNAAVDSATQRGGDDQGAADTDPAGDGNDAGGEPQTRNTQLGGARTQDRDPGYYLPNGAGQFSYVGDQFLSKTMGSPEAAQRLQRHSRAVGHVVTAQLRDVLGAGATTAGQGLVPPVWLANQFAPILHKRLRVASRLRQVPWAGPFAWTIPVASTAAKTSSVAEGVNTTETDPYYTTITVTPKAIMGYSEVSRQMLEASNPAVDSIIWGDLIGDFYDNAELEVIAAINAQSGVNTVTVSAGVLTTTDIIAQRNGLLDAIAAVSDNNAGDANLFVGRNARWVTYLKFVDTTGRPLILAQRYSPMNAIGDGTATNAFKNTSQGSLENLDVATSPTVGASTGFVINGDELLFSISPPMQFRFEEPAGPALIRVGIWGYEAVSTGRRPKAITKITYSGS